MESFSQIIIVDDQDNEIGYGEKMDVHQFEKQFCIADPNGSESLSDGDDVIYSGSSFNAWLGKAIELAYRMLERRCNLASQKK